MKKIILLVVFLAFSMSISSTATANTKTEEAISIENSIVHNNFESEFYYGNGGLLQLIYNAFHKLGSAIYTTISGDDEKEEETNN